MHLQMNRYALALKFATAFSDVLTAYKTLVTEVLPRSPRGAKPYQLAGECATSLGKCVSLELFNTLEDKASLSYDSIR
eukprot:SAG11_NODE_2232_length_3656_cov_3.028957_3_plen_78_part_00